MKVNRFLKKYKNKTNAELEEIISNKEVFVEDAISAAVKILSERNYTSEKSKTIISEIKENKALNEIRKEKYEKKENDDEKKENYITSNLNATELYSKKVITVFSALFATIFGTILLMYNMKKTNNQKGQKQVLIFGIIYTVFTILILNYLSNITGLAIMFNIFGGIILTEFFWNMHIGKEYLHRTKNWIKPAIISVIIIILFLLVIIYE